MKVFITGSKGYFGKPLVEKLGQSYEIARYDIVDGNDILNYEQ